MNRVSLRIGCSFGYKIEFNKEKAPELSSEWPENLLMPYILMFFIRPPADHADGAASRPAVTLLQRITQRLNRRGISENEIVLEGVRT